MRGANKVMTNELNDSLSQVPLGKLAYMPGKLVHTNEVLALLGDNWFAETSAKHAAEIVARRQKGVLLV